MEPLEEDPFPPLDIPFSRMAVQQMHGWEHKVLGQSGTVLFRRIGFSLSGCSVGPGTPSDGYHTTPCLGCTKSSLWRQGLFRSLCKVTIVQQISLHDSVRRSMSYRLQPKLLVSPLGPPIVVPYIPYVSPLQGVFP